MSNTFDDSFVKLKNLIEEEIRKQFQGPSSNNNNTWINPVYVEKIANMLHRVIYSHSSEVSSLSPDQTVAFLSSAIAIAVKHGAFPTVETVLNENLTIISLANHQKPYGSNKNLSP